MKSSGYDRTTADPGPRPRRAEPPIREAASHSGVGRGHLVSHEARLAPDVHGRLRIEESRAEMPRGPSADARSILRTTLPMGADRVRRDRDVPFYLWVARAPEPVGVFTLASARTRIGREAEA